MSRPRILFCGEALIDFITTDGATYRATPGGSPYSASKATAQAGGDAAFCGAISTDLFGEEIMADLAAYGVDTALAPRLDDPTVLGFIQVAEGQHPRYAFFDRDSAMVNMAPVLPGGTLRDGDVLGIGSISLIVSPGADRIADFALGARGPAVLALDPNVRPGMIAGHDGWRPRMDRLVAGSDIVKISTEDLDFYAPGTDPDIFATGCLAGESRLVIVTDGENGATAYAPAGRATRPAPTATGGDTVGAGDTLLGYALTWLAERGATTRDGLAGLGDDALADMLRLSVTAASMNCRTTGCNPPARAEVEAELTRG
ncbi:MAG: PfkB family carbohydrate kinase [Pseudomonadota bacterium]